MDDDHTGILVARLKTIASFQCSLLGLCIAALVGLRQLTASREELSGLLQERLQHSVDPSTYNNVQGFPGTMASSMHAALASPLPVSHEVATSVAAVGANIRSQVAEGAPPPQFERDMKIYGGLKEPGERVSLHDYESASTIYESGGDERQEGVDRDGDNGEGIDDEGDTEHNQGHNVKDEGKDGDFQGNAGSASIAMMNSRTNRRMVVDGSDALVQDCSGETIATVLNSVPWMELASLKKLDKAAKLKKYEEHVISAIEPFILAEPSSRLIIDARPVPLEEVLDCGKPEYAHIFSGTRRRVPMQVINFVPVGYNLRLLEARLYELEDAVDYFVLFETRQTQTGATKPLFLERMLSRGAFKRFSSKIIHLVGDDVDAATLKKVIQKRSWDIEDQMRTVPLQMFRERMNQLTLTDAGNVLVVASDEDEIPTGLSVYHLSHCDLRPEHSLDRKTVFFNVLGFKNTLVDLKATMDGTCISDGRGSSKLSRYAWGSGPIAQSLSQVLKARKANGKPRGVPRFPLSSFGCLDSRSKLNRGAAIALPVGSGVHLSSPRDPGNILMKQVGTIEAQAATGRELIVEKLVKKGLDGNITGQDIFKVLVKGTRWSSYGGGKHTSNVFEVIADHSDLRIWYDALPWVIKLNPERFCWELPADMIRRARATLAGP